MTTYTRYMTPYDRAWDMAVYTEYMWSYDGICQGGRIPDAAWQCGASGLLVSPAQAGRLSGPGLSGCYAGPSGLRQHSAASVGGLGHGFRRAAGFSPVTAWCRGPARSASALGPTVGGGAFAARRDLARNAGGRSIIGSCRRGARVSGFPAL